MTILLTVTIPIDTTPHHSAWQCTAKDIETAFITGGEANLTISGNYLWLRTHKLIPHENFSVLSPVFKHFQLFGSVLPSGMVTVKFTKRSDSLFFLTVETEKANFGAWNLSFDIVKWYRWEF